MNQYVEQKRRAYFNRAADAGEYMRSLAAEAMQDGWARLRPYGKAGRELGKCIARFEDIKYAFSLQDEAYRRLSVETGSMEELLARVSGTRLPVLPACGGTVRIEMIAEGIISGGERRLDVAGIMRMLQSFQSVRALDMHELLYMPDALAHALLDALIACCRDVIKCAQERKNAQVWVECGGKGRLRGSESSIYIGHALRCAEDSENTAIYRRIEAAAAQKGRKAERVIEEAHGISARLLMRAENLISAWHMLRRLDWQEYYEILSAAEGELKEDPSGVYPRMDKESRAEIRRLIWHAAKKTRLNEDVLIRAALSCAQTALKEHGAEDPRSTICYYFADDEGRKILSKSLKTRGMGRIVPDSSGRISAALITAVTLVAALIFGGIAGNWLYAVLILPLAWVFVMQMIARLYSFFIKPRRLLKIEVDQLDDDARTLVVIPVLLSGEGRVHEMIDRMETLGCLEKDKNIDFLLLGDFRDADAQSEEGDEDIIAAAREGIRRLNLKEGREKYFYLHRERVYRPQDEKWMGHNRKRGAVRELNALMLGKAEAKEAFSAENSCAEQILGAEYRYAVTLDADTAYIPGAIQKLVGAMMHPLNRCCVINGRRRGYAVLQPAMQLTMRSRHTAYAALMNDPDGTDSYPFSISDFYQDICAAGGFAGKGIYDVRAYYEACEGRLREERTLSHDLVEGILSGGGMAADIRFYESCPAGLSAELGRTHRWMRGDWQNAYLLFSKLPLRMIDRIRIAGNLIRSLHAPALLFLLIFSAWSGNADGFALGIALAFTDALLHPFSSKRVWKRALFRLAVLPAEAVCALDAVIRTLWRTAVSQKKLMEWTTAADDKSGGNGALWGRIAAILLLPALLNPGWIAPAVALGALFLAGRSWAEDLSKKMRNIPDALNAELISLLGETALSTWRFFEKFVPEDGNGLPPDNVQVDPPVGVAHRTSPTNIGLYLVSCLAAYEMGFVRLESALKRIANCISTLENMDKWHGQLYNWYDTRTLQPLRPRYVSSVDSGNLAASLLMIAHAFENAGPELSKRAVRIAEDMDFAPLYDEKAELFRIGVDVENDIPSRAHYDLYASEARILSFTAMMLNKIPVKHWQRLNRAAVNAGSNIALISWSGTMFEYLMPEIFMRSHPDSLAGASRKGAVGAQMEFGRRCERPWGISESGYYAFDMHLNYQYRAFGLQQLALSANAAQDVVAPYATALALCEKPAAAARNLKRMKEMGWHGEYGFYEAADYLKREADGKPRIVKSHMAHHQGMILCAVCNVLRDNVLSACFADIPQARALMLLLDEKPYAKTMRQAERGMPRRDARIREEKTVRSVRRSKYIADAHLLSGGGTTALVTGRGSVYAWHDGIQLNRFSGDIRSMHEGMYVHISSRDAGESLVMGEKGEIRFDLGCADISESFCGVQADMRISVSPENGALIHAITLKNTNAEACELQVAACFAVALAPQGDMRAHPAFQNLFVETSLREDNVLLFKRRPRDGGKTYPLLAFAVFGGKDTSAESDMEKLTGRNGAMGMPGGISNIFDGAQKNNINPCGALRTNVRIAGGGTARIHFVLAAAEENQMDAVIDALGSVEAPERAARLSSTLARADMNFTGINAAQYRILQRASAILFDAHLQPGTNRDFEACESAPRELLWRAGISGDLPVICADVSDVNDAKNVRDIIRMHAFYRNRGVWTDLVLIDNHGNDYQRPVHSAFADMIACSHLGDMIEKAGGVYLIDGKNADENVVCAVKRAAAFVFSGKRDVFSRLEDMLDVLAIRDGSEYLSMRPSGVIPHGKTKFDNGYGGFADGGYRIHLENGLLPPAPWSNIIAEGESGAVITERCGGFAWSGNSRSERLTAFTNDTLHEGWGWMFYAIDRTEGKWLRLLPGDRPMTDFSVLHKPCMSLFSSAAGELRFDVAIRPDEGGIEFEIRLENTGRKETDFILAGFADWLMGTDESDRRMLRTWNRMGACFASGAAVGTGYFACDDPRAYAGTSRLEFLSGGNIMYPRGFAKVRQPRGGWVIEVPVRLKAREAATKRFVLGAGKDAAEAYERVRKAGEKRSMAEENRLREMQKLKFETPDEALNLLANGFLQNQALSSRILAKTGLYQPGGAYGFRDQLQDMLLMIHYRPDMVRKYLLKCASRQFEAGDVLHWWHEPMNGVRTHISDDKLVLPYVTAEYVRVTGDEEILADHASFLKDIKIPEGSEDIYAQMQPSENTASLHEHCMRAFRSAEKTGQNGLCLMGSGDWNDGMNRIGAEGRGESVWLSMFAAVCARKYAEIAKDEADRAYLLALNERLCAAVEENGWDGAWYLRAYADDGSRLGGRESTNCRIDIISQAWSVFAGLDSKRSRSAMNAAWERLVDENEGIIRLLDPPFDGKGFDPGYIAAYPPGIRENGAQYTHAACWYACALAEMGDADRVHRALKMLLPVNHAKDSESAEKYRVEPYVMSADIYTNPEYYGRGGWTWYTGSAQWMMQLILAIYGYERRGKNVRINALLGDWQQASLTVRFGSAEYVLAAEASAEKITLDGQPVEGEFIAMVDDGLTHHAVFPPRCEVYKSGSKTENTVAALQ